MRDPDVARNRGTEDQVHWLVWNIPGTATGLPEGVPKGATLPDGCEGSVMRDSGLLPPSRDVGLHSVKHLLSRNHRLEQRADSALKPEDWVAVACLAETRESAGSVRGVARRGVRGNAESVCHSLLRYQLTHHADRTGRAG
jgi:hypothetical protein